MTMEPRTPTAIFGGSTISGLRTRARKRVRDSPGQLGIGSRNNYKQLSRKTSNRITRLNHAAIGRLFRSDSKTVSTRGGNLRTSPVGSLSRIETAARTSPPQTRQNAEKSRLKSAILNVPPEHIIFTNGKHSWTFTAKKTYPQKVGAGENHQVTYIDSKKKVWFRVHWAPNPKNREIILNSLYFVNRKERGEIPAAALVQGLKEISNTIHVMNDSFVPLSDGKKLKRILMPNETHNIYRNFYPEYDQMNYFNGLQDARALVQAIIRGNRELDNLSKLVPTVNKSKLRRFRTLLPPVGSQASDADIERVMTGKTGIISDILTSNVFTPEHLEHGIPRTWRRTWRPFF